MKMMIIISLSITTFIIVFSVSPFPFAAGISTPHELDLLTASSEVVRDVLQAAPRGGSSIILITDGSTSSEGFLKVIGDLNSSWGTTVLEIPPGIQEANKTREYLSAAIADARRVRQASTDVTLLVITDNDDFLTNFAEVCDDERLLVWSSRLLLVTNLDREKLDQHMERYWVFSMMNTMVLVLNYDSQYSRLKKADVIAYLPYRPGENIVQVATWTPTSGLKHSSIYQMFPEKYSNFFGSYMNVTCWPFMPYFMSMEEVTGESSLSGAYTGRDYIMLETLASILNFTINILPVESWDEMMLKVVQRVSFMSPMKMSILPHLLKDMDFSIAYEPETLTFAMKKPELKPRWQNLYYPLNNSVWALTLATVGLMPFVLFVIDRLRHDYKSRPWSSPWLVVQETIGTFLGQPPSPTVPNNDSFRILMAAWVLFTFLMGSAYRANLTAFLTLPKYPPRIETLKEFIKAESIMLIPPDTVDFYNGFKQSPPGDLRTLSERMFFVTDISEGFPRVLKENAAYMYERRNLELNIARYYTSEDNSWTPLYVARDNIWPGSSAWPIVRDAPFKPTLDRHLRRFVETGLLYKWDQEIVDLYKRATRESRRKKETEDREKHRSPSEELDVAPGNAVKDPVTKGEFAIGNGGDEGGEIKPLSLVHLQGPLFILLFILVFAVLVFAVEVFLGCPGERKL
ncbi:glutamate receptor ionotropic, delta-1-like [Macrobrachium nipponense]|uniref:glutamate receptor ionotropic, delta-1-like n=1 Tax=Macrobrachium nipponense TaxID=159736 RepID=UPI0030C852B9